MPFRYTCRRHGMRTVLFILLPITPKTQPLKQKNQPFNNYLTKEIKKVIHLPLTKPKH